MVKWKVRKFDVNADEDSAGDSYSDCCHVEFGDRNTG
jgi:hypothetical protein